MRGMYIKTYISFVINQAVLFIILSMYYQKYPKTLWMEIFQHFLFTTYKSRASIHDNPNQVNQGKLKIIECIPKLIQV